jgi:hypothetical protein
MKSEQIRDRIVVGILDKNLSEKLQIEQDLTLEKCVTMARNIEIVKNQIRSQQDVAVTDEVRGGEKPKQSSVPQPHVSRQQDATKKFPGKQSRQSKKIDNKRCSNCNKYHARGHCAAFGKI